MAKKSLAFGRQDFKDFTFLLALLLTGELFEAGQRGSQLISAIASAQVVICTHGVKRYTPIVLLYLNVVF